MFENFHFVRSNLHELDEVREGMDRILNGANRHKHSQLLRERSPI